MRPVSGGARRAESGARIRGAFLAPLRARAAQSLARTCRPARRQVRERVGEGDGRPTPVPRVF